MSITAIDLETNGTVNTISVANNGISEKQTDPKKSDPIQNAMGSLGRWHMIVCAFIFLMKFPVAWHQMRFVFLFVLNFFFSIKSIYDFFIIV